MNSKTLVLYIGENDLKEQLLEQAKYSGLSLSKYVVKKLKEIVNKSQSISQATEQTFEPIKFSKTIKIKDTFIGKQVVETEKYDLHPKASSKKSSLPIYNYRGTIRTKS